MAKVSMDRRDKITLALMVMMSVFFFADQRIMSAVLKEISLEYGVGNAVLGNIGSAFTLIGAVIGIIFGYFTDKVSRKNLLVLTVLVGEIPCFLTGFKIFTPTIEAFTVLRILTGIGIGGIFPITFSLVADYFHEEHRASASAWIGVAWAIGMIAGPMTAGFLTGTYGWRFPFAVVAVPGFVTAIFFAIYARDPQRGRTEAALEDLIQKGVVYKQKIKISDFRYIFSNKTNIWLFLQGIPGTVPWGILGYWMIDFWERARGVEKETASIIFLVLGAGATVGALLFAYIGEHLYNKKPKYLPILCGTFVILGVAPSFALLNLPLDPTSKSSIAVYCTLAFFTGLLVSVASGNVKAIIMNVNRPEHRGSVFAVFNITDNIGQGFGPAIGGYLLAYGYVFMMNFALPFWLLCGLLFFFVAKHITKDRDELLLYLDEKAHEMKQGKQE